jgi:uncharacterized delta-60 repeat protein
MKGKSLRNVALSAACVVLVTCSSSTTTTTDTGPTTAFTVMRLTAGGVLDTGFGAGKGFVSTHIDPSLFEFAITVAVQPDNKIVAGGSSGFAGQGQIALVRYNADGSLDTAGFGPAGTGGVVRTPTPAGWSSANVSAIAVQAADNKIVVAALAFNAPSGTTGIALVRYLPNGTLDAGFGTGGVAVRTIGPGFSEDTCAMVLQGTNILVAGASRNGNIVLARYDSTGTLDPTFGTSGVTTTTIPMQAMSPALAFQSTGNIILVSGTDADQAVLRYTSNGALDTAFGPLGANGIVITDAGGVDFANAVAVQSDDKIVVVGHANVNFNLDTSDISLVRYNADGTLDISGFNAAGTTPGIVITDIAGKFDSAFSVVLQTPGAVPTNIIVSGNTGSGGFPRMAVLRYLGTGALDASFAGTGVFLAPIFGPSTIASANAVALQSTLGIVAAGYD